MDGTGSAARFCSPTGVAADPAGNVYVADGNGNPIRRIAPGGAVTTLATGPARGVAVDAAGHLYFTGDNAVQLMGPGGAMVTLAGLAGLSGSVDGTGTAARFKLPNGVAVDATGTLHVADTGNHIIRRVTPSGVVMTLAGVAGAGSGSSDGTGSIARFHTPRGAAADAAFNLYVADSGNHTIRKIAPGGVVTTLAGLAQLSGGSDGTGSAARFNTPQGVAVDAAGTVFVADTQNHTIRRIGAGGVVTTLAGLSGSAGSTDGTGHAARFNQPYDVAVTAEGTIYVADYGNQTVRKVTASGVVTTLAGLAGSMGTVDGAGSSARFQFPSGVAVDSASNVFVADVGSVRR